MKRLLVATAIVRSASPVSAGNVDNDIACAASALASLSRVQRHCDEWYSLLVTYTFFIGRLTGRDEKVDWQKVVLDRLPAQRSNPHLVELQNICQDLVIAVTPTPSK
jgi:hypothetical protein